MAPGDHTKNAGPSRLLSAELSGAKLYVDSITSLRVCQAFFEKNEVIVSSYEFVVKVVDFLYNKAYTVNVEQKSL